MSFEVVYVHSRVRLTRPSPLRRLSAVLAALLLVVLASSARAAPSSRRLVLYTEVTGRDTGNIRARLRQPIPTDVILVDVDEFRAALTVAGQSGSVGDSYGSPLERPALL